MPDACAGGDRSCDLCAGQGSQERRGAVLPMLHPGSELAWGTLAGPEPTGIATEAFRFVVFNDPAWQPDAFDASTDIARLERQATGLEPPGANLKPFFSRGGRLLMYHGWADQQVAPLNSITYFKDVVDASGKDAAGKSIALYSFPEWVTARAASGRIRSIKWRRSKSGFGTGSAPAQIVAAQQNGRCRR